MKREVYYIIYATEEENQNGTFHFSPAFKKEAEARKFAKTRDDVWVVLEKHWEKFDRYEWRPDWERSETSTILEYF